MAASRLPLVETHIADFSLRQQKTPPERGFCCTAAAVTNLHIHAAHAAHAAHATHAPAHAASGAFVLWQFRH